MHQQLACVLLTPHVNCAPQPGHTESGAREFSDGEFMLPMIRAKAQIIRTTNYGLRVAGCGLRNDFRRSPFYLHPACVEFFFPCILMFFLPRSLEIRP